MADKIRVEMIKSGIGRPKDQNNTLRSLGLTKMHKIVTHDDNPVIRGMIYKVRHLVRVLPEEA